MSYFVREHAACSNKYSDDDIIKMLDCLIDTIFVDFVRRGGLCSKQIPHKLCSTTTCFSSNEAEFLQRPLRNKLTLVDRLILLLLYR